VVHPATELPLLDSAGSTDSGISTVLPHDYGVLRPGQSQQEPVSPPDKDCIVWYECKEDATYPRYKWYLTLTCFCVCFAQNCMVHRHSKTRASNKIRFLLVILGIISPDNLFAIQLRWVGDALLRVPPGNRRSGSGRAADAQKCVPPGNRQSGGGRRTRRSASLRALLPSSNCHMLSRNVVSSNVR
jgi:hypothetical protein